ncbi:DDHD domain-containing protein [Balamuthia mandrillaris]
MQKFREKIMGGSSKEKKKPIGEKMEELGYKAKHPILLVPGFFSTAMKVEQGAEDWVGERIWVNLSRMDLRVGLGDSDETEVVTQTVAVAAMPVAPRARPVFASGFLLMQVPALFGKTWKEYYFRLEAGPKLSYYLDSSVVRTNAAKAIGSMPLDATTTVEEATNVKKSCFCVRTQGHDELYLATHTTQEAQARIQELRLFLKSSFSAPPIPSQPHQLTQEQQVQPILIASQRQPQPQSQSQPEQLQQLEQQEARLEQTPSSQQTQSFPSSPSPQLHQQQTQPPSQQPQQYHQPLQPQPQSQPQQLQLQQQQYSVHNQQAVGRGYPLHYSAPVPQPGQPYYYQHQTWAVGRGRGAPHLQHHHSYTQLQPRYSNMKQVASPAPAYPRYPAYPHQQYPYAHQPQHLAQPLPASAALPYPTSSPVPRAQSVPPVPSTSSSSSDSTPIVTRPSSTPDLSSAQPSGTTTPPTRPSSTSDISSPQPPQTAPARLQSVLPQQQQQPPPQMPMTHPHFTRSLSAMPAPGRGLPQYYPHPQAYMPHGFMQPQPYFYLHQRNEKKMRKWIKHMVLQDDGCSDPAGIKVRPIPGIKGCSYLAEGLLSRVSFVMGPLIKALRCVGYTENNLQAASYDWRLPPHYLQQRDNYFSKLKETVETLYENNQKQKVVIIAHSMGNRVVSYFLHAMAKTEKEWLDKHIYAWTAIGAPWLGSPKALRAVISGEKGGLSAFLSDEEALKLQRSCGSVPWLFPIAPQHYFLDHEPNSPVPFAYLKTPTSPDNYAYVPRSMADILKAGGATNQLNMMHNYYMKNEYFGGEEGRERVLHPPPISKLFVVYSINLETEAFFFYKANTSEDPKLRALQPLVLDKSGNVEKHTNRGNLGYVVRGGIAYETPDTKQKIIKDITGEEVRKSGDGTVPYCSLHYPTYWESVPGLEVRIEELEGVNHRDILADERMMELVIEYVCERDETAAPTQPLPLEEFSLDISTFYSVEDGMAYSLDSDSPSESETESVPEPLYPALDVAELAAVRETYPEEDVLVVSSFREEEEAPLRPASVQLGRGEEWICSITATPYISVAMLLVADS